MSIDERIDAGRMKAPQGRFAVFVWDPAQPADGCSMVRDYKSESAARRCAEKKNREYEQWVQRQRAAGFPTFGETEYLVINDKGMRV